MERIVEQFDVMGRIKEIRPYGSGHINDTILVTMEEEVGEKKYILQRINTKIFTNPEKLMENIVNVTKYLKKQIIEQGGDPERETLNVILTKEGKTYWRKASGECYRMYVFIQGATSFDAVEHTRDFYESAVTFGRFQALLADFPAETLHETIPEFHNTKKRFETFKRVVKEDVCHRAATVQEEINFVLSREKDMYRLCDLLIRKELPLRVTHNDTKLNNILIDNETRKGICVIDLDTVMPGLSLYDFGDAIRFGANTAAEDELDLSKVSLDLKLYEWFVKGYLEGAGESLTQLEIAMLPTGAKTMTLECGMRFLTDYLQGDVYFKIHREHHNLDRCRTQFALVKDMEAKWSQMEAITN